jgi:hypothetical protein
MIFKAEFGGYYGGIQVVRVIKAGFDEVYGITDKIKPEQMEKPCI